MAALAAVPSTSVALVITRSSTLGIANGIAVAVGIVLGDLAFILLAIFGLSSVAEAMGSLFVIVKYLGAAYLLWLGYTLLTSKNVSENTEQIPIKKRNLVTSFLTGFIVTLGDIKAIIFYVSLFPVFLDLSELRVADVLTIILVMVVSVGGIKTLYACFARKVTSMARKYNFENATRKTAGGLMVGAGGYLIVKT